RALARDCSEEMHLPVTSHEFFHVQLKQKTDRLRLEQFLSIANAGTNPIRTMLRQTALIHLCLFLAWQTHILGQPVNDQFENRIALSGTHVLTAISFVGATLDAVPETYPFAASDIWYSWTAAANGSVKVEANDELGY